LPSIPINLDVGNIAEKLIRRVPQWVAMPVLSQMLGLATPFNRHLSATISVWERKTCEIKVKVKRKIKNHLGGLHSGAIATIGEMAAGMVLIRNINLSKYRLILKELNTVYVKQIKQNAKAVCYYSEKDLQKKLKILQDKGRVMMRLQTDLYREDGELASTIRSYWQVISRDKLKDGD